jgi:hypothetical protein
VDEKTFDATVERLKKANVVISKLDPAIRADAFSILAPYVKGAPVPAGGSGGGDGQGGDGADGEANADEVQPPGNRDDLLNKHGGEPVDNVLAAAAAWYMDYGSTPFSKADLQDILDSAGMTAPVRVDRTLDTTTKGKQKHLFRKASRGRWVPSVAGEAYFRETFKVAKGTKKPPEPETA